MNVDRSAPTPDPWADYFDAPAETPPARPEVPADVREPTVASVTVCFDDGTFMARLPDGAEVLAVNDVFPHLASGHPVVLYPATAGGWSLVNPAWYLQVGMITLRHVRIASRMDAGEFNVRVQSQGFSGRAHGDPLSQPDLARLLDLVRRELPADADARLRTLGQLSYGDPFPFTLTSPTPANTPLLPGTLEDGTPAVLHRDTLSGLASLPLYDFTAVGAITTIKVHVLDPATRPVRVGVLEEDDLKLKVFDPTGQNFGLLDRPGLFFLALHELARRCDQLPAVVIDASEHSVRLALYGVVLDVFAEQVTWQKQCVLRRLYQDGQTVEVHVAVDLDHCSIFTSLRFPEEPGWEAVRHRYPVGARVVGATYRARTREGVIVDIPSPDLRLPGLLPYGELTDGNDPVFLDHGDLNALPELVVTSHDVGRRRLILSLRQARPSIWDRPPFRTGQVIPVAVVVRQESGSLLRWAAGHLQLYPSQGLPRADLFWARVEAFDPGARRVRLASWQAAHWTVTDLIGERLELRADDGTAVRVERSARLRHLGPGDRVPLVLIDVAFRLDGPLIYCKPLTDLDPARELLRQETVRPVTLVTQTARGYVAHMDDLEVFLPFTEAGFPRNVNFADCLGQSLFCRVVDVNDDTGRITVSRRKTLLAEFEPGQIRKGVVKNIAEFGAFVDLGGLDGLLHVTDMAWGRVNRPAEVVHVDQQVEVVILKVDREKGKIAVGLKQKTPSPWANVEAKYPVGSRHTVEVVNVMSYGAFVKLEPGIEGLVHISDMNRTKRLIPPKELVSIGDQIEVQVLNINKEKEEISLGIRQLQPDPWDRVVEKYPLGTVVDGVVGNLTNYGAFVEIEEGIEGLLHVSELSWVRKVVHPSEVVNQGDRVCCVVLNVDQDRKRIALSLNQTANGPWEGNFSSRYKVGEVKQGKVSQVTHFGAFVELEPGLTGLLHRSELAEHENERPQDLVQIGQSLTVRILSVDPAQRHLRLGLWLERDGPAQSAPELPSGLGLGAPAEESLTQARAAEQPPSQAAVVVAALPPPPPEVAPPAWALPRGHEASLGELASNASEVARPPSAPKAKVAPPEPALSAAARGFDPSRLLRRVPHEQRAELDEEEHDGLSDVDAPGGGPAGDGREPDGDLDAWLRQVSADTDLAFALDQCGLHAAASLVRATEGFDDPGPTWEPLPPWATLSALLSAQTVAADGPERSAVRLEVLLRALAGNPVEGLLFERFAEFLPAEFVAAHPQALERWLQQHANGPPSQPGLALLEARARERLGQVERAWTIANDALAQSHDDSLAAERERLVHRFREDLQARAVFFDRFDRDFTRPVRQGGFAFVIPVRDRETGDLAALKHYLLKNLMPAEMQLALDLFAREAAFLRRIRHVNVVGFRESLGRGCILLEWLPGRPLDPERDVVGAPVGWWTLRRALELGLGVARALEAVGQNLHADFTHNDMAPRNIMIHPESYPGPGWVKLIDFGLSSSPQFYSVSSVLDELGVRLREAYRAPEVAAGAFGSPRSDIYALGVILFQMLTGQLPREPGVGPPERVLREAPPGTARLLERMLDLEPKRRPGNWREVAAGLQSEIEHA